MLRRLSSRLTYSNIVATAALFLALGGTSYAAFRLPSNSVGNKQLKAHSVTPSKVAAASVAMFKGQKGATGLQGPTGPQGPQGPQGHQGLAGATKVVERETSQTTAIGQDGSATVQCNSGEVATGGGWHMETGNTVNFYTFGPYPVKADNSEAGPGNTPTGWAMTVYNNSTQADTWHVYAICASP